MIATRDDVLSAPIQPHGSIERCDDEGGQSACRCGRARDTLKHDGIRSRSGSARSAPSACRGVLPSEDPTLPVHSRLASRDRAGAQEAHQFERTAIRTRACESATWWLILSPPLCSGGARCFGSPSTAGQQLNPLIRANPPKGGDAELRGFTTSQSAMPAEPPAT